MTNIFATSISPVHVIGGGLAGSEAAWQLARAGVPVILHENAASKARTPTRPTALPSSSAPTPSAPTMPKPTRRRDPRRNSLAGSLIMSCADRHQVPAVAHSPSTATASRKP